MCDERRPERSGATLDTGGSEGRAMSAEGRSALAEVKACATNVAPSGAVQHWARVGARDER